MEKILIDRAKEIISSEPDYDKNLSLKIADALTILLGETIETESSELYDYLKTILK